MKQIQIFGRYLQINQIPHKILEFSVIVFHSFLIFKFPIDVLQAYIARRNLESQSVPLCGGGIFHLSGSSDDVITMVINFCGKEYGRIRQGDTVVDIGANIGAFSVVAARSGVKTLISVEPNSQAFMTLRKNIEEGGHSHNVHLENRAVGSASGEIIYLPKESSPMNRQQKRPGNDLEAVKTISLKSIIEKYHLRHIDILKVDCEGAEFTALYKCPPEVFAIIRNIRIEIHPRRDQSRDDLERFIVSQGFRVQRQRGLVTWFAK